MTDAERKALIKAIEALQSRLDDHVDATVETLTKDYTAAIRSELADAYDALPTDDDGRFDDQAITDVLPRVRRKLLTTDDVYRTIGDAWLERLDATAEQVREGFDVDPGQQRTDFTRFDLATIDELKGQWPRDGEPGGGLAGRFFSLTDEHRRALADALTRAVLGRRNERELIAELAETVAKDGRSAKWLFDDGTMQFSRSVTLRKADSLGYEWFRYNGPQDSITRPFCSPLVDQVFKRTEIDAMDNRQTGAGTVMIAGGGYRCRHHWRPVRPEWFSPEDWEAMGGEPVEAAEEAPDDEPTERATKEFDQAPPPPGTASEYIFDDEVSRGAIANALDQAGIDAMIAGGVKTPRTIYLPDGTTAELERLERRGFEAVGAHGKARTFTATRGRITMANGETLEFTLSEVPTEAGLRAFTLDNSLELDPFYIETPRAEFDALFGEVNWTGRPDLVTQYAEVITREEALAIVRKGAARFTEAVPLAREVATKGAEMQSLLAKLSGATDYDYVKWARVDRLRDEIADLADTGELRAQVESWLDQTANPNADRMLADLLELSDTTSLTDEERTAYKRALRVASTNRIGYSNLEPFSVSNRGNRPSWDDRRQDLNMGAATIASNGELEQRSKRVGSNVAHEITHALENANPKLADTAGHILANALEGKTLRHMGEGYRRAEISLPTSEALKLGFDPYTLKPYLADVPLKDGDILTRLRPGDFRATEISTMVAQNVDDVDALMQQIKDGQFEHLGFLDAIRSGEFDDN